MSVGLILPSIRPEKVKSIIEDLCRQTVKPDKVFIIDNGCNIDYFDIKLISKGFQLICLGYNIGCNAAWNYMFDLDTDYVGAMADDLRLDPHMIEIMIKALHMKFCKKSTGIVTATTSMHLYYPKANINNIRGHQVESRKNCGAFLMKKCTANCIPPIPKVFFNYYGDNYFGFWMNALDLAFIKLNVPIVHRASDNLEYEKKKFKKPVKTEFKYWKDYIRGKSKYSP